jgi:hypothetical protein
MFTVLEYEVANKEFWQPDKTKAELENPLELGEAATIWREMTDGLLATQPLRVSGRVEMSRQNLESYSHR